MKQISGILIDSTPCTPPPQKKTNSSWFNLVTLRYRKFHMSGALGSSNIKNVLNENNRSLKIFAHWCLFHCNFLHNLAFSRYMNNRNVLGLGWGLDSGYLLYLYFGCLYIEKAFIILYYNLPTRSSFC